MSSIVENLKSWIRPEDDEDEEDMTSAWASVDRGGRAAGEKKEVSIRTTTELRVVVAQPKGLEDVPGVADDLKRSMTVVLNVASIDQGVARRILDTVSGVAYALDATITRIASGTYMILPFNVEFEGGLMDELTTSGVLGGSSRVDDYFGE
jgi:FtsZ-interacting cell division protein YlmF